MSGYENYDIKMLIGGIAVLLAVLAAFLVAMWVSRYRSKRRLMAKIRREWGQRPSRQYEPTEFDNISHYYLNRETEEFQIDDITWNDLDMDRIFQELNRTRSFLGESYLYYQLRSPALGPGRLEEFEELVTYYQEHPQERERMEYFFARIGKTRNSSVFDYIYNLTEANAGSNLVHFAMWLLMALSVGVLLVVPQAGVLLLIAAIGISMGTYEYYKRPITPYVTSCMALEKILTSAEEIAKIDSPLIERRRERLLGTVRVFEKLRRNMFLLVTGDMQGGGLEQLIIIYLNNCFHLDLIQFKTVVRQISGHIREFETLVETMGELESAIAVASYRTGCREYAVPVLQEEGPVRFWAEDMYHPLIGEPVANSIDTEECVLLTGSNASGKSTFLKTAAVTAVLAQTIHTVTARSYQGRYFRVFSSMALRDDLAAEESYYMVEIRSLKRILDRMEGPAPVLCCVDEVLRGTNTVERVAASSQILKRMAREKLICFAATHDIELTYLLEGIYRNCHFEEEVTDEEIRFDYRLKEGRAMTRNAIRLLALMGFEESIIEDAQALAATMSEKSGLEFKK